MAEASEGRVLELRRRARANLDPAIPPPGRDPVAARAIFEILREKSQWRDRPWEFLEGIAFDLDLFVPLQPARVESALWPEVFPHPAREDGQGLFLAFTGERLLRGVLETRVTDRRCFHHLSGFEVLRWCWASPSRVEEVGIDIGPESSGLSFSSYLALAALFPLWYQVGDLERVESVGLPALGELPGARALKPEVLRALSFGWKHLVSIGGPGARRPLEVGGRRYLPVFSGVEPLRRFEAENELYAGATPVVPERPPFGDWLDACADCDGVVLDPQGGAPLPIDRAAVLALDWWTRRSGPLNGGDWVRALAGAHARAAFPGAELGRAVAEWPEYFVCVARDPAGDGGRILRAPRVDVEACPVFTSRARAEAYLAELRASGIFELPGAMGPAQVLTRWSHSAFHTALCQFEEAWLDPPGPEAEGLRLDRACLEVAVAHVEQRLCPRIPGFLLRA